MITEELGQDVLDIIDMFDRQMDEAFERYVVDCLNAWYDRGNE